MDVLLAVAAGCSVLGLTVLGAVLGTRSYDARKPPARGARSGASTTESMPLQSLEERVAALERAFPAWRIAMDELADQCEEVLGRAERKRRAARMSETRAGAGDDAGEQPALVPADPNQHRAAILHAVRTRRGTP